MQSLDLEVECLAKYKTYDRIKDLCREQGKTVRSLEEAAGLRPDSIKRWADSRPIANSLFAVANVLGVPAEQLLDSEEEGCDEEA